MRERPILFSSPMVRALLAGTKTQTRRIMKPQPEEMAMGNWKWHPRGKPMLECMWHETANGVLPHHCPYGLRGDRLWVRESFSKHTRNTDPHYLPADYPDEAMGCWYWADGNPEYGDWTKPKPSIHMPRWASRITLEITGVRVQRLQGISEEDAKAEGLTAITKDGTLIKYGIPDRDGLPGMDNDGMAWSDWEVDPRRAYRRLWESINGAGSWDANPWVWCVSFRRTGERESQ